MTDPYPDDKAYVRAELDRLDPRLRIEVERFEGPVDEFGSLYVSEAEVRDLLAETDHEARADGATTGAVAADRHLLARRRREIRERRRATAEAGDPVRLDQLVDRFDLVPVARDLVMLALAPDVDETYATVYAYLQDDATQRRPTVGFCLGVLDDADQLEHRSLFTRGSPLVDEDLLSLDGDGPLPTRTVAVDGHVASFLLGEEALDPDLASVVTVTEPDGEASPFGADDSIRVDTETGPPMIAIYGPGGTGKQARVEAHARERSEELLTLDARAVPQERLAPVLDRVSRAATLRNASVHVEGALEGIETARTVVDRLDDRPDAVYLTGETAPGVDIRTAPDRHEFVPVSVERADFEARRAYWERHVDRPEDLDPSTIASTFQMSRGAIDDALAMARGEALAEGETLTAAHVYAACRDHTSAELTDLARRIEPSDDWADIVLPSDTEAQLREVADRLRGRGTVYGDWGFGAGSSLGNGLVVLFSGPSGTGKTMAAEVVAGAAGLHVYKVDLAAVISKYVGETESNLGRVFDEAADSDAVLLFDEADAVFGERSEVSDAHDRYANVEVDYLLQRVEEHEGAVILTTNMESNIDDAFMRRIHVGIEFPHPDRTARRKIWRRVFPDDAPVGDLDYEFLARLDLSGGDIRNVALTAAFYAATDGGPIDMQTVVRAVRREFQKNGTPIEPARFGEYRDVIEPG